MNSVKGQTLPAERFVRSPSIAAQLSAAGVQPPDEAAAAEQLVLGMAGPFEQRTGGKGANAAAAAARTGACALVCCFGSGSVAQNGPIFADLAACGGVDVAGTVHIDGLPTGTAYILLFDDGDNAIVLLGGANQVRGRREPQPYRRAPAACV